MKRIHVPIFGMANSRRVVLDRFVSLSRNISDRVIKCVVYENSYNCLDHWIHEISAWIHLANSTQCKSKLKASDYVDTLFGYFGTDESDAGLALEWFQLSPNYKQYSQFAISEELVSRVYTAFQRIINTCVPILISKEVLSASNWFSLLKPILAD